MSCDEQVKAPTELFDKRFLDGFTDRRACPDHRFVTTEPPYASLDRRGAVMPWRFTGTMTGPGAKVRAVVRDPRAGDHAAAFQASGS